MGNIEFKSPKICANFSFLGEWQLKAIVWKLCCHIDLHPQILPRYRWMHISISLRSRARWLQILPFLKYFNVLEWESRFTLGLNAAKNTDYIKKSFKKLFKIKFATKDQWTHIFISPTGVELGGFKYSHFLNTVDFRLSSLIGELGWPDNTEWCFLF